MRKMISIIFFLVLAVMSWQYLNVCFAKANSKDFDSDESKTFLQNISQDKIPDIILHGVRDQGSAAPLDYVPNILLYRMQAKVNSFGLPFDVYYRLNSIAVSFLSGLIIVLAFYRRIKDSAASDLLLSFQFIFVLMALAFYYFWYSYS